MPLLSPQQQTLKNAAEACRHTPQLMKNLTDGSLKPMKEELKKYEEAVLNLKKYHQIVVTQKSSLNETLKSLEEQSKLLNSFLSTLIKDANAYSGALKPQYDKVKKDLHLSIKLIQANHELFNNHLKTVNSVPALK